MTGGRGDGFNLTRAFVHLPPVSAAIPGGIEASRSESSIATCGTSIGLLSTAFTLRSWSDIMNGYRGNLRPGSRGRRYGKE